MHFKRIFDSTSKEFEEALAIYTKSFPHFEQRALSDQIEALSNEQYYFQVIQNAHEETLGILLTWETDTFVYIEHFAIAEQLRGQNMGSTILETLRAQTHVPLILEIDPPIDAISIRRKEFYQRLGFVLCDYAHYHPPYKKGESAYTLKILSNPKIDDALYDRFYQFFRNTVLYYSFSRQKA